MGSRALLARFFNKITSNSQQCSKYISSSSVRSSDKNESGTGKALQVQEPINEPIDEFFRTKEEKEHIKAMKNYITVESEKNVVGIVSGVPDEHIHTRTVRIYRPAKNAMQSGTNNIDFWQICFDTRERWENPLMGWCSSGDPLQSTRVNFETVEEAVRHCENMGWKYIVQKPNESNPKPRSYGANFSWDKRTRVTTK